jgi:hypothetical protein
VHVKPAPKFALARHVRPELATRPLASTKLPITTDCSPAPATNGLALSLGRPVIGVATKYSDEEMPGSFRSSLVELGDEALGCHVAVSLFEDGGYLVPINLLL